MSDEERYKLVNEAGYEAFQLLVKRMEALGEIPFGELFSAMVGASAVCMANTLRPAIEQSTTRSLAADNLSAQAIKQVRALLESAVRG